MPPLIPPLASLVLGILAAPWIDARLALWPALLSTLLALVRPRAGLILIFLAGSLLRTAHSRPPLEIPDDGYASRITARIEAPVEHRPPGYYLTVALLTVDGQPWWGRARLSYFPDDETDERRLLDLGMGSGDEIEVLVRLQRPRTYRNPGVFDYRAHLERRGVFWTGAIRSPRLIEVTRRGVHLRDRLRQWATVRIGSSFETGSTVQALALGMVLGQRDRLTPEERRRFEDAGLVHLLVVSGFNLALVAAAAFWLGRRLPLGAWTRTGSCLFAIAVVLGYTGLVEGEASVARAAVMAMILISGRLLDRGYSLWNTLAAAALLILLFDPLALWDSGFQLTFGAVLAILCLGVPMLDGAHGAEMAAAIGRASDRTLDGRLPLKAADRRVSLRAWCELHRVPVRAIAAAIRIGLSVRDAAWITFAVQAALFPLTVESYHRVSLFAAPLNVIGAAAAAIVTPAGLALLLLPNLAHAPLVWLIDGVLGGLDKAVAVAVELPGGSLAAPSPPAGVWAVYGVNLVLMAASLGRRQGAATAASCAGLVILQGVVVGVDFHEPASRTTVTFLDVGQGDAAAIELTDGRTVLVDGGGSRLAQAPETSAAFSIGKDVVGAYLFNQRVRRLDVVVLTHAHADHMGGLFDVIRNFEVGEIWIGVNPATPGYRALLEDAARRGIPVRPVRAGDRLPPFEVLNPPSRPPGREVRNDDSIVLLLDDGVARALLTGDFEGVLEAAPPVDILKVPHHGSANVRLRVPAPIRVISVGAGNSYGHPHPSHLPALRTDLLGAIRVELGPERPVVAFPGL